MVSLDDALYEKARQVFAESVAGVPGTEDPGARDLAMATAFAQMDGLALCFMLGPRPGHLPPDVMLDSLKFSSRLLFPRDP
jgi:hypothetical protein